MSCEMNRINKTERASSMSQASRIPDRSNCAERIRGCSDSNQARPGANGSFEFLPNQFTAWRTEGAQPQRHPAFALQRLPGRDVCLMIQFCDDNLVLGSPSSAQGARQMERQCRHIIPKNHLTG